LMVLSNALNAKMPIFNFVNFSILKAACLCFSQEKRNRSVMGGKMAD